MDSTFKHNNYVIAYVPESFPQSSETFVINEIKGVLDSGYQVLLFPRLKGDLTVEHKNYNYIKDKVNVLSQDLKPNLLGVIYALRRGSQRLSLRQCFKPILIYKHIINSIKIAKHAYRISHGKPDVILVHFGYDNAVAGAIASKILGCPLILWLHGSDVHTVPHRSIKWISDNASVIFTNSKYMKENILSLGVTRKIQVSNLGVGDGFFSSSNSKRNASPLLISIARLGHHKNHDRTLRVLKIVKKTIPDVEMLFVGDGPDKSRLVKYARNLQLENNVTFLGAMTQEEIQPLLKKSWVKVLFSDKEGLGLALIEAQAGGVPCVASKIGGIPEVILDKVTGFLVDFSEKNAEDLAAEYIVNLLSNEDLRIRMGSAANKRAEEKFSEKTHVETMVSTIINLMEDKNNEAR